MSKLLTTLLAAAFAAVTFNAVAQTAAPAEPAATKAEAPKKAKADKSKKAKADKPKKSKAKKSKAPKAEAAPAK